MMKRRSFLAMLGIGAASGGSVAAATVAEPAVAAPIVPQIPLATTPVTIPSYMVRVPVTISLTQDQLDVASMCGISPIEYANQLLRAKQCNEIEGDVDANLEYDLERIVINSKLKRQNDGS